MPSLVNAKRLCIFDFDDTLVSETGKVRIIKKDGEVISMESSHFANYVESPGDIFDFSDFQKVVETAKVNTNVINSMISFYNDSESYVVVITAREKAQPVREFILNNIGIDLPVFAVGGIDKKKKASVVGKLLSAGKNIKTAIVFEDMIENLVEMCMACASAGVLADGYHVFSGVINKMPVHEISLIHFKENLTSGAGFIILNNEKKMLALETFQGTLDIPKGIIDSGETSMEAAFRELKEEAGIVNVNFPYGQLPIIINNISVFIGASNDIPNIIPNPKTGMMEHIDYHWINIDNFCNECLIFLKPFGIMAREFVS